LQDGCLPPLRDPHYDRVVRIGARKTRSRETVLLFSSHRLVAMAVAVVVWAASAGSSEASPQPPSGPEDVLSRVGELFRGGQDRFETSDFDGAIEQWTRAYEELPRGPEHQAIRAMLLANLAQAHVEAHAIGGDLEHLRQADGLFVSYLAMIDPQDTQTHETIGAERRRIAGILEAAEEQEREQEQERAAGSEPDAGATDPEPAVPAPPRPSDEPPLLGRRDRDVAPYTKWERAMVIGGGATLTFAVGLTGAAAAFLWLRNEEEERGFDASRNPATGGAALRDIDRNAIRFHRLTISTGTASGVLAAIGLGLVGAAFAHRRRRLSNRPTVVLGPGATLVVWGRF
jgi:MYXO-CTERM domain-containing protein